MRYGIIVVLLILTLLASLAGLWWDRSEPKVPNEKQAPQGQPQK
jgi:hypothetical protein